MEYFDLHCDTLFKCYTRTQPLYHNDLAVSLSGSKVFDSYCQFFAVWIDDELNGITPFDWFCKIYNNAMSEFGKNSNVLDFCTTAEEIELAVNNKKTAAILSIEGGSVLEGDINNLKKVYDMGVRMITLTWNGSNEIASGCGAVGGLTDFGSQVINEMNNLGMICDLSHLNDKSFDEAIEQVSFVAASHSCLRELHNHQRNLTNDRIEKIAAAGGVLGICPYSKFLGQGSVMDRVYAHISAALDLGCENNLAIGSDFDGADLDVELNKVEKIPALYEYLSLKGLKEDLLNKVFYKNAYDFTTKVLTKS